MKTVLPPLLAPGARVALVAPSGPLSGEHELEQALANVHAFGWEAVIGRHALSREGFLAGSDDERRADLDLVLRDRTIDGVWFLRGGYGATRVLDHIDYDALRRRPKALIGYSDITAVHCAVHGRTGLVTYHGPTARSRLTAFTTDSLRRAVVDGEDSTGGAPLATPLRGGRASGRIAGGNLALLASLAGTDYAPRFDGAIAFLEDINEAPYRVDRMLRQLRMAGAFDGVRALAFGDFGGSTSVAMDETDGEDWTVERVVAEFATLLRVPALLGVPIGHIDDQWTLPLGCPAEIDVEARAVHTRR
ncbi:MAG TPA: LD-carboxypeptidase [Gemmatimonadaceae bacterium]|nr:LD-carboxypeptidase [Gemmatimonadaceae bacterium]